MLALPGSWRILCTEPWLSLSRLWALNLLLTIGKSPACLLLSAQVLAYVKYNEGSVDISGQKGPGLGTVLQRFISEFETCLSYYVRENRSWEMGKDLPGGPASEQ